MMWIRTLWNALLDMLVKIIPLKIDFTDMIASPPEKSRQTDEGSYTHPYPDDDIFFGGGRYPRM